MALVPSPQKTMALSDDVTCPLCMYMFDQTIRVPKILPCDHTFCFPCMKKYTKKALYFMECPLCKEQLNMTAAAVKKLQTNHTVLAALEKVQKPRLKNTDSICDVHGKVAEQYCTDCKMYLCSRCLVESMDNGAHFKHEIEDVHSSTAIIKHNVKESLKALAKEHQRFLDENLSKMADFERTVKRMRGKVDAEAEEVILQAKAWRKDAHRRLEECVRETAKQMQTTVDTVNDKFRQSTYKVKVLDVDRSNDVKKMSRVNAEMQNLLKELRGVQQMPSVTFERHRRLELGEVVIREMEE